MSYDPDSESLSLMEPSVPGAGPGGRQAAHPAALPVSPGPEPAHILAGRWLIAARSLRRVMAGIGLESAVLLGAMKQEGVPRLAGFASFQDFAREVLFMAPRTVRRRVALARIANASSLLRDAYLAGRLSACKVLALGPISESPSLPFWAELAETIPLRELAARIREAAPDPEANPGRAPGDASSEDRLPLRVTFAAPVPAGLVWEEGLSAARRVLGWNAPVHECVAAILGEHTRPAGFGDAACEDPPKPLTHAGPGAHQAAVSPGRPDDLGPDGPPRIGVPMPTPASPRPGPPLPRPLSPDAIQEIRQTLAETERILDSLAPSAGSADSPERVGIPPPTSPASRGPEITTQRARSLLNRFAENSRIERELRLIQGRLLHVLWTHDLHRALGACTLSEFVEIQLGLSPRSARALVSEAMLFRDEPLLARAYRRGRIGTTQARMLHRVTLGGLVRRHIRRAGEITVRELERETRFLVRLADLAPEIRRRHPGPLPDPGLETALVEALVVRGQDPARIRAEVESRYPVGNPRSTDGAGEPDCDLSPGDPAENPLVLSRLELLLDLYALAAYPDGVAPDMQHFSAHDAGRQTLAARGMTTISFHASPDLLESWTQALEDVRWGFGPLPIWASMVLLVKEALEEWHRTDPDTRPTEHAVLERDDYACRAPGCSSRRNLEVHHIRFRSRGGTDHAWNKVTLCHTHHHHGIHAGSLRVTGAAPARLRWELGLRLGSNRRPLLMLQGERIVRRTWPDPEDRGGLN